MTRANERKFHYIYKITRTDGKYYIGMHSTDDVEDGYFGSGQLLWKSIKKHGKEKHLKEILEFLPSRSELKKRERELVNEEILDDVLCMNLKLGGEGGWEHITPAQKIAGGKAGGKISGLKNWRCALSKVSSDDRRKGLETRVRNGNPLSMAGRSHTSETRVLMSASGSGERNSQFGSCWVCKEHPIKIKQSDLAEFLAMGYRRGRK